MKLNVYSVFDSKLAMYDFPFYFSSDAAAIRGFGDEVNNPQSQKPWCRHPEDYQLFKIGEFDNDLGQLVAKAPLALVTASAVKNGIEPSVV